MDLKKLWKNSNVSLIKLELQKNFVEEKNSPNHQSKEETKLKKLSGDRRN